MDLSHPEYAVLGENRARVLHRLSVLAEPVSGRRIHELSGVKTLRTTQQILADLVNIGLVTARQIGSANAYVLNREHVLWGPIEQILASPARTESDIASILQEVLDDHAAGTALFGSFARGEAGPESDVDILVVWDQAIDAQDAVQILDEAAERIQKLTGNRAQLLAFTKHELEHLIASGDPLAGALRSDARQLTSGLEIKSMLRGGRR